MIPEKAPNFRLDADVFDLDLLIFLQEFTSNPSLSIGQAKEFKRFLVACSDWTEDEVGKIRLTEMTEVVKLLSESWEAEKTDAVPLPSDKPLTSGPEASPEESPSQPPAE